MKKINISKITKILCWIAFFLFYLLSIETTGYITYKNENIVLSYVFLGLTLITFLVLTSLYCKSKNFLIIFSVYFLLCLICMILMCFSFDYIIESFGMLFLVIYLSFFAPFLQFEQYDWANKLGYLGENDYSVINILLFVFVVVLFYATYFISRKIANRKNKT